jgi:hypothetical protein
MRRVVVGVAILLTLAFTDTRAAGAQTIKMDVPAGLALTTVTEPPPKKSENKSTKGIFKDLRPGSCKVPSFSAPVSSWPARGEPLIAFCRP